MPVGVRLSAEEFAERCGARVWQRVAKVNWRPFEEAREFVRSLGLSDQQDWKRYCVSIESDKPCKPFDIPTAPHMVYRLHGWRSMGDWLGSGRAAKRRGGWREFSLARAFVRQLGLRSEIEWRDYYKGKLIELPAKPIDIPTHPAVCYADRGWVSWSDWLGTGWRSFREAREFVRGLRLGGRIDWQKYCAGRILGLLPKPSDIPSRAQSVYANEGWVSWGDWVGTNAIADRNREFRPFEEACAFVHALRLRSQQEWFAYCKGQMVGKPPLPRDIPVGANRAYNGQWRGWSAWLGTDRKPRKPKSRKP
jgi:hypothetical protein